MAVDPKNPAIAAALALPLFQSQKNNGTSVAPKVPARTGCPKAPWARI
jgi:hypothetical protein